VDRERELISKDGFYPGARIRLQVMATWSAPAVSVRWLLCRGSVPARGQVIPDLISKDQPRSVDLVARHDAPLQPAVGGQFGHSKNLGQLLDGEVIGVGREQIIQPAHRTSAHDLHDTAA
jgi:hypothetical protein